MDPLLWEDWVRQALSGTALRRPSPGALRQAIALGHRLSKPVKVAWVVRLLFDSALEPLPAGVRGAAGAERRTVHRVEPPGGEPGQLDLRVRRESADSVSLVGQLLPPLAGAWVEARAGRARRLGPLSASGEFLLRGFPARARTIRLAIGGEDAPPVISCDVPLLPKDDKKKGRPS